MAMGSEHGVSTVTAVILALLGVGTIAVLISKQSQTTTVTTSGGSAISRIICTALSPITGGAGCGLIPNVTSTITFGPVT